MKPQIEQRQVTRLKEVKQTRNNLKVRRLLGEIRNASEGRENLMPLLIDGVREYATVQEICDVWREVYGHYSETAYF